MEHKEEGHSLLAHPEQDLWAGALQLVVGSSKIKLKRKPFVQSQVSSSSAGGKNKNKKHFILLETSSLNLHLFAASQTPETRSTLAAF